jgi:hypothetical protein
MEYIRDVNQKNYTNEGNRRFGNQLKMLKIAQFKFCAGFAEGEPQ